MAVCASLAAFSLAAAFAFRDAGSQISTARKQASVDTSLSQISFVDPEYTGTLLPTAPLVDGGNKQNSAPPGNPLWAIPLDSLNVTRERPLFSPSRRPPAIELASVPSRPVPVVEPPQPPSLSLVGAISGKHDGIAIFRNEATKGILRLKVGESHLGWTLREVTKREATLQNDRQIAIFGLPTR